MIKIIIKFFEQSYGIKFNLDNKKITNIINSTSFEQLKSQETKYGFEESVSGSFFEKANKK